MAEKQDEISSIENIISNTESMFSGGRVTRRIPEADIPSKQEQVQQATQQPATATTTPVETPPQQQQTPEKQTSPANEPKVIQTPLFTINQSQTPGTPEANPLDDFNKKTGLNLTSIDEIYTKADEIATALKTGNEISAEVRKALETQQLFEKHLPAELQASILAFIEGKDYKSVMKQYANPQIDFKKRFDEYADVYPIVNRYSPEITREDYEEMDETPKKAILSATRSAYNAEFETNATKVQRFSEEHQSKVDAMFNSIDTAMANVKKEFPSLSESNMKEIRSRLELTSFTKDFMNQDGTYKPDAGVRLGYSLFGKETIDVLTSNLSTQMAAQSQQEIQQRTAEEIALMTRNRNDVPPPPPSSSRTDQTPEEAMLKMNRDLLTGHNTGMTLTNRNDR